jgi:hypothetical protein
MSADPLNPQDFRLDPSLRRCSLYGLTAAPLVVAALVWAARYSSASSWDIVSAIGAVSALFVAIAAIAHRWRLRVDERGIARRRFFGWDLWPWEAFKAGRIDKIKGAFGFTWKDKPWWKRKLDFGYLSARDRLAVVLVCNEMWMPPPMDPVPDELKIRRWGRRIDLTPTGITVRHRGKEQSWTWRDVRQGHIRRLEHDRRDFQQLKLVLPDHELVFNVRCSQGQANTDWRGSSAEHLAAFLERHVDPQRVRITALMLAPRTVEDAEDRLAKLTPDARMRKTDTIPLIVMMTAAFALNVYVAVIGRLLVAALFAVALANLVLVAVFMARSLLRRARIEREALERWLETGEGDPYDTALAGFHR